MISVITKVAKAEHNKFQERTSLNIISILDPLETKDYV